jgi:hypothetical protein
LTQDGPARHLPGRGGTGKGLPLAMVRAHSRACTLSVINGNSRRNSAAVANSPLYWRISQH